MFRILLLIVSLTTFNALSDTFDAEGLANCANTVPAGGVGQATAVGWMGGGGLVITDKTVLLDGKVTISGSGTQHVNVYIYPDPKDDTKVNQITKNGSCLTKTVTDPVGSGISNPIGKPKDIVRKKILDYFNGPSGVYGKRSFDLMLVRCSHLDVLSREDLDQLKKIEFRDPKKVTKSTGSRSDRPMIDDGTSSPIPTTIFGDTNPRPQHRTNGIQRSTTDR